MTNENFLTILNVLAEVIKQKDQTINIKKYEISNLKREMERNKIEE
jgi:hypothetical protein